MAVGTFSESEDRNPGHPPVCRDALVVFGGLSDAELTGCLNALRHELADCADLAPEHQPVCETLVGGRLAAAEAVVRRRAARHRAGRGPNPADAFSTAWSELADQVRQRADLLALLAADGYPLTRRGREWCGPCFACGGEDRLVVFPAPDGRHPFPRAWCRRCGRFWDAVTVLRNLRGGRLGYYDAVAELAGELGLALPAPPARAGNGGKASRRPAVEIVGGKVVAR